MKQPYKYWSKGEMLHHLKKQRDIFKYKYSDKELEQIVYDKKWDILEDYNGCNVVQDDLHPFLPCCIHDYRWIVEGRTNKSDKEFSKNLRRFGYSKAKAMLYYIAVRVGSLYFNLVK